MHSVKVHGTDLCMCRSPSCRTPPWRVRLPASSCGFRLRLPASGFASGYAVTSRRDKPPW